MHPDVRGIKLLFRPGHPPLSRTVAEHGGAWWLNVGGVVVDVSKHTFAALLYVVHVVSKVTRKTEAVSQRA